MNIRQYRFLKALLEAPNIEQACKQAGINKTTGYKYLKDPIFLEEYRKIRREAMQVVISRLQKASEEAVTVLHEVMMDKESPPASRVQSAKNVLDIAYRSVELDDIQERLESMEEVLSENGKE